MIANLPLLFANGNPTALSKISAGELEKFITFMVTCSWGHDTAKDIRKPPWWPIDVAFTHPFCKPCIVPLDWEIRLKNLVKRCYDYHKSAFLLVFSAQLARYPRKRLRYVDNRDHTTSLYYRPSGRLLVTFRNENIFYDKNNYEKEEEPRLKPADILYLCDNCDSHFDNVDTLQAHERLCNSVDLPSGTSSSGLPDILSALKLIPIGGKVEVPKNYNDSHPRNVRNVANIDRGPPYPFSSLAYTRNIKTNITRDTTYSRERIERYCILNNTKMIGTKTRSQFPNRFRRPIDYWQRKHVFPNQRNKQILDLNAQLLLLKCKPVAVRIERMSKESMDKFIENLKLNSKHKTKNIDDKDVVFIESADHDNPIEIDTKTLDPLKPTDNECEVIDLCSDDENPSGNENCDPRAGVTCVMRGGAVLRRTAATPHALPAEPCGARHRPLPATFLQPHPVILIAHTLNDYNTISLE